MNMDKRRLVDEHGQEKTGGWTWAREDWWMDMGKRRLVDGHGPEKTGGWTFNETALFIIQFIF